MKFCQQHWDTIRKAIDERALSGLVAKDGATAVAQMASQLQVGSEQADNFDPLMAAHWAIVNNVMSMLNRAGMNPLYLLSAGDEEKCDGRYGPRYEGRPWPRCPLCYLNLAHEVSCTDAECTLDKERGYDWMVERAADDSLTRARELGLAPRAS